MVIDDAIRNALKAAIKKHGNVLRFSRAIGISHTTVLFWLKGRTDKINMTLWNSVVYPAISEYLDDSYRVQSPRMREKGLPWTGTGSANRRDEAVVLSFTDLETFDPQFDPIEEMLSSRKKRTAAFTSPVLPGYFAIEVDTAHEGYFHAGTRLLLAWADFPGENETVIAKLRDGGRYVFGRYHRDERKVVIRSLDKKDKPFEAKRSEFHETFCWIAPLREAVQPL